MILFNCNCQNIYIQPKSAAQNEIVLFVCKERRLQASLLSFNYSQRTSARLSFCSSEVRIEGRWTSLKEFLTANWNSWQGAGWEVKPGNTPTQAEDLVSQLCVKDLCISWPVNVDWFDQQFVFQRFKFLWMLWMSVNHLDLTFLVAHF